jgi:hypothetical protein
MGSIQFLGEKDGLVQGQTWKNKKKEQAVLLY